MLIEWEDRNCEKEKIVKGDKEKEIGLEEI